MRTFHEIAQRWRVRAEDFPDEKLDTDLCFAAECTESGRRLPLKCNEPTLLALESASSNRPMLNRLGGVICQMLLLTQFADVDTDCPVLYSKDILGFAPSSQFSQYGGPLRAKPYIYCPEHNKLLGAAF